jgi:hypothetical protein
MTLPFFALDIPVFLHHQISSDRLIYSLPALRLPIASSLHQSLITSPQSLELSVFFWQEASNSFERNRRAEPVKHG